MQLSGTKHSSALHLNLSSDKPLNTYEAIPPVHRSPAALRTSYTNASTDEPEIVCKRLEKTAQVIGKKQPDNKFNPVPITVQKTKKKVAALDEKYFLGSSPSATMQTNQQRSPVQQNFNGMRMSSSQQSLKHILSINSPLDKKEKLPIKTIEIKNKDTSSSTIFSLHGRTNSQPNLEHHAKRMSMTMLEDYTQKKSPTNAQSSFQNHPRLASPPNANKQRKSPDQNLEKLIKLNAKKALAEKKKQKKHEDYLRMKQLEKKHKLEEENRKIRLQNLNYFPERTNSSPKFAWGVDQRKFSHPQGRLSSSPESHHYETNGHHKKMSEKERRERLGLSYLNENFAAYIAKKKSEIQRATQKDEDQQHKPHATSHKKLITEQDRQRIKEFMNQKQKKLKESQEHEQISKKVAGSKIKENLEKLTQETKEKFEKLKQQRKLNKSSAATKSTKNFSNKHPLYNHARASSESIPNYFDSTLGKQSNSGNDSEEGNYSFLYNEYKKIMNKKSLYTRSAHGSMHTIEGLNLNQTPQDNIYSLVQSQKNLQKIEPQYMNEKTHAWKESMKHKYGSLIERYEKNIANARVSAEGKRREQYSGYEEQDSDHGNKHKKLLVPAKGGMKGDYLNTVHEHFEVEGNHPTKEPSFNMSKTIEKIAENKLETSDRDEVKNLEGVLVHEEGSDFDDDREINGSYLQPYEIAESAAIFIQKNFRGYRTRKILREYFQQLCRQEEEEQRRYEEMNNRRKKEQVNDANRLKQHHLTEKTNSSYEYQNPQQNRPIETANGYEDYGKAAKNGIKKVPALNIGKMQPFKDDSSSYQKESEEKEDKSSSVNYPQNYIGMNEKQIKNEKKLGAGGNVALGQRDKYSNNYVIEPYQRYDSSEEDWEIGRPDYEGVDTNFKNQETSPDEYSATHDEQIQTSTHGDDNIILMYQQQFYGSGDKSSKKNTSHAEEKILMAPHNPPRDEALNERKFDSKSHMKPQKESIREHTAPGFKDPHENVGYGYKSKQQRPDFEITQKALRKESKSLKQSHITEEEEGMMRTSASNLKNSSIESHKQSEKAQKALQQKESIFPQEKLNAIPTTNSLEVEDHDQTISQEQNQPSSNQISQESSSRRKHNTSLEKSSRVDQTPATQEQKRPSEIPLVKQKSDSSLMRDNIIAELKIIEQQAENEKETNADALEKELERANKQQKAGDHGPEEYLLKLEESGRPSWSGQDSKGNDSPKADSKRKSERGPNSQEDSKLSNSRTGRKGKEGSSQQQDQGSHFKEEFLKLKEDQMNQWNDLISQLMLLKNSEAALSNSALNIIETMQQKLENQKKKLEERGIEADVSESAQKTQTSSAKVKEESSINLEKPSSKSTQENLQVQQGPQQNVMNQNVLESEAATKTLPAESHSGRTKGPRELTIDTEAINEEFANNTANNEQQQPCRSNASNRRRNSPTTNLDLRQLRVAMGSEQFVRENLNTSNSQRSLEGDDQLDELQSDKTPGSGLFDRDPFKEFAQKKFKEMLKQENVTQLISLREKVLDNRHKTQVDTLKKMLETNRVSPRTFHAKTLELEKWVTRERDQINKSKFVIEKGLTVFQETVKRTNRDILFMKKANIGEKMSINDLSIPQLSNFDDDIGAKSASRIRQVTDPSDGEGNEGCSSQSFRMMMGNEPTGVSKVIKIIDQYEMKEENLKSPMEKTAGGDIHQDFGADSMSLPDLLKLTKSKSATSIDSQNHSRDNIEDGIKYKSEERAKLKEGVDPVKIKNKTPEDHLAEEISPLLKEDLDKLTSAATKNENPKEEAAKPTKESQEDHTVKEKIETESIAKKKTAINETPSEEKKEDKTAAGEVRSQESVSAIQTSRPDIENGETPKLKAKLMEMGNSLITDTESEDFEEYLRLSGVPSFKGQIPTELSLSSNLSPSLLSPLIAKEYFPAPNKEGGPEKQNLQAIFEQTDEASPIAVQQQQAQKRETMKDKIDELFKDFSPREKEKLIMIPDPISDRLMSSDTFEQEENKSETALSPSHGSDNKQLISPRLAQAVEQRAMEKVNFKEIEEEAKAKSKLMEFIENSDNVESSSADNQLVKEAINQPANAKLLTEPESMHMPGISTDIPAVRNYVDFLIEIINTFFKEEFLTGVNTPTGLSPHEKLAALHGYDIALLQDEQEFTILDAQAVLGVKIYLSGEEKIREMVPDRPDFISDVEIIHNKAIFDAFNEALDYLRPYSVQGMPYPWKMNPRTLPREIREDQIPQIMETTKQRVLQWAQFKVGFLGRGIETVSDNPDKRAEVLSILREEKLSKALTVDIQEKEDEWINYDDQRMELQIELSDLIFEKLTMEAAEVLYNIQQKNRAEREALLPPN